MTTDLVTLLDADAYPIVRLYPERVTTMRRFRRLCEEWAVVIARGPRFAVISMGDHPADEPDEVRRERALFFKRSRDVFRNNVAVIVNVEPDPKMIEERRTEAAKAAGALGFNIVVVRTESEAYEAARRGLDEAA